MVLAEWLLVPQRVNNNVFAMRLRGFILFLFSTFFFLLVTDVFGVDKEDKRDVGGVAGVFYKGKIESFCVVDIQEIGATGNSVPERLEAVYNSVKDYSKEDYAVPTSEGVIKVNLGRIILRRCIVVFAALMILFLGLKIIPVMYSPDKELDSKFWIKPTLLALFLATYAPCMGFVDKVMRYLSFKDYTETNVAVVKDVTTVYEPRAFWRCVPIANLFVEGGAAIHNANVEEERIVDTISYGDFIAGDVMFQMQQNSYMEEMARKEKLESGEQLSEEEFNSLEEKGYDIVNGVDGGPVTKLIMNCINDIVVFLVRILTNLIRVVQTSVLCLLFVGGPVAVVCEMVPGLEGSVKKWFGVFVRTHLITPIIFVMDVVRYHLMQANMASGAFLYLCFSLCLIVLYFKLEKITGYFISAEGAGVDSLAKATGAVTVAGAAVAGAGVVAVSSVASVGAAAVAGKIAAGAAKASGAAAKTAGQAAGKAASTVGRAEGNAAQTAGRSVGNSVGGIVNSGVNSVGGKAGNAPQTVAGSQSTVTGGSGKSVAEPQQVSSIGQKIDPVDSGRMVRTNDQTILDDKKSVVSGGGDVSAVNNSGSSQTGVSVNDNKSNVLDMAFDVKQAVKSAAKGTRKIGVRVAKNAVENALNVIANDGDLNLVGTVVGSLKNSDKKPEDNQSHRTQMNNAIRDIDEQRSLFMQQNPTAEEGVFESNMFVLQNKNKGDVVYFNPQLNKFSVAKFKDVEEYRQLLKDTGAVQSADHDFNVDGGFSAISDSDGQQSIENQNISKK